MHLKLFKLMKLRNRAIEINANRKALVGLLFTRNKWNPIKKSHKKYAKSRDSLIKKKL